MTDFSISHLIQPTNNYYLVIDYIKSLIEVQILNLFNTILTSTALGSNLVVTLIQLLPFELRSYSKSAVFIRGSSFVLRLKERLVF